MPRGVSLGTLLDNLRNEAGLSSLVSLSINQKPQMIRLLQRTQRRLYFAHDWPMKHITADKLAVAGQRYYDFPATMDPEKAVRLSYRFGTQWIPIPRGITPAHYSAFDSDNGARNSPLQRWEYYGGAANVQFETWPISSINGTLNGDGTMRWSGVKVLSQLVNDDDTCEIDSDILVLFSAAEMLAGRDAKDAAAKLQAAKDMLRDTKGDMKKRQQTAMGAGQSNSEQPIRRRTILVGTGSGI